MFGRGFDSRQLHRFIEKRYYFHGQGITPLGFLSPLKMSDSSHELGLRAASFNLDIVKS